MSDATNITYIYDENLFNNKILPCKSLFPPPKKKQQHYFLFSVALKDHQHLSCELNLKHFYDAAEL